MGFAVKDATMLVFVVPHQFVEGVCKQLVGKVSPHVEAISLIKGMEIKKEGCLMMSSVITRILRINCCVLMGANLASEVILRLIFLLISTRQRPPILTSKLQIAEEKLSEATIGYREDKAVADKWIRLFKTPYFLVASVSAFISLPFFFSPFL